ncbi:GFA family protein [Agrobacterium sp. ES01]|uniref:GFA family protein n=1 Tax=Agrobacterium sp. ES01 TaxID=3420714 RepID=UPI003D10A8DC
MQDNHHGSCLCGAVRFQTSGPLREVIACHCSQCRKQTGLYYAATDVDTDRLTIEGEDCIGWYRASPDARRGFCKTCGSALFWVADGARRISILAGAFEQPSGLTFGYHIYCADKGDFYTIDDAQAQYPAGRPS